MRAVCFEEVEGRVVKSVPFIKSVMGNDDCGQVLIRDFTGSSIKLNSNDITNGYVFKREDVGDTFTITIDGISYDVITEWVFGRDITPTSIVMPVHDYSIAVLLNGKVIDAGSLEGSNDQNNGSDDQNNGSDSP